MRRILRYFRRYFHARQFDHDLTAEMQAHLDDKIDDLIERGLTRDEARAQALREFGNRTMLAEKSREKWTFTALENLAQDLRYALRILRKNPGFAAVAILSLALGIGSNVVIFSAVNHVLLSPLPYPQSGRLVDVWSRSTIRGLQPMHVSAADFYDWRAQSHSFQSLSAYASWPMNLTKVEEPRRIESQLVSANLFSTLGVNAEIGRTFVRDEDLETSQFVVVLSHRLWRALGETRQIIGRELILNGSAATVIGVMPADFSFPSPEVDAWVPLSLSPKNRANREGRWLRVIGRLAPGSSFREAAAELDAIALRLAAAYPATNSGWTTSVISLKDDLVGNTRPILLTLQAGAILLLLITCANLANLLLATGASRNRELSLRAALGAGRGRILRQLIIESGVTALLGGIVGIALAMQCIGLLRSFGSGLIPRAAGIHLSPPVVLFAIAVTVFTALIFGVVPAWQASKADLRTHIDSGARSTFRNVERRRGLLVAVEIAIACVLLVGAGLLGSSLVRLLSTSPGLRTDHLLTMRLTLPKSKYPTNASQIAFFQEILDRANSIPGVVGAAEISDTPLQGNNPTFEWRIDGVTHGPTDAPVTAGLRAVSAGYFQTAGIPILKGRSFTVDDRAGTMAVAIVNETMARRYWAGMDAVGRTLRLKEDRGRTLVVAGVAPDIKHMGLKADEGAVVYIPYAQKTQDWLAWTTLMLRTSGEPHDFVPAARNAIKSIDKSQPVSEIATLEELLARSTALSRFTTSVIAAISGLALVIAVIGVYGLLAYTIARRVPEIGIRLTLGAAPREIVWLLVRQTLVRVLAGISMGLVGSWWLSRWTESLLFGVRPHDPATLAGVAAVLVMAALVAVLIPARRVLKIDPSAALRWE